MFGIFMILVFWSVMAGTFAVGIKRQTAGYSRSKKDEHGNVYWYNSKGKWHRKGGPAIESTDGTKYWYQNGKRHRTDGPAAEYAHGDKWWCQNGEFHRLDGPAIEWADGRKQWWVEGKHLTEKEFLIRTVPKSVLGI